MKKITILSLIFALFMVSCKTTQSTNKNTAIQRQTTAKRWVIGPKRQRDIIRERRAAKIFQAVLSSYVSAN